MASTQIRKRIDEIFPRLKNGEGIREIAREIGIHHTTILGYQKGRYWQSLEQRWEEFQSKLRQEEKQVEQGHIKEHGGRYKEKLSELQNRFFKNAEAMIGISNQLLQVSGQAVIALSQETQRNPNKAESVCSRIQKSGVAKTAIDASALSKEARAAFSDAGVVQEVMELLESAVNGD